MRNTIQFSPIHPIIDLDDVSVIEVSEKEIFKSITITFTLKSGVQIDTKIRADDVTYSQDTYEMIFSNPVKYGVRSNPSKRELQAAARGRDLDKVAMNFYERACSEFMRGY